MFLMRKHWATVALRRPINMNISISRVKKKWNKSKLCCLQVSLSSNIFVVALLWQESCTVGSVKKHPHLDVNEPFLFHFREVKPFTFLSNSWQLFWIYWKWNRPLCYVWLQFWETCTKSNVGVLTHFLAWSHLHFLWITSAPSPSSWCIYCWLMIRILIVVSHIWRFSSEPSAFGWKETAVSTGPASTTQFHVSRTPALRWVQYWCCGVWRCASCSFSAVLLHVVPPWQQTHLHRPGQRRRRGEWGRPERILEIAFFSLCYSRRG